MSRWGVRVEPTVCRFTLKRMRPSRRSRLAIAVSTCRTPDRERRERDLGFACTFRRRPAPPTTSRAGLHAAFEADAEGAGQQDSGGEGSSRGDCEGKRVHKEQGVPTLARSRNCNAMQMRGALESSSRSDARCHVKILVVGSWLLFGIVAPAQAASVPARAEAPSEAAALRTFD